MNSNKWFVFMVAFAFAAMISFFQINSYTADKHHLNGVWTVAGIIFTLTAIYGLYKVKDSSK